ncbi:MAG TPA: hypothetical protein PLN21_11340 [Gemmatales bacterium]|nr:hypothetical protein [Gemmatales bacterium]
MIESSLTQLKIIVERAVRPVRASSSLKRKMREELLAHVTGVFEEEAAKFSNERAALEHTAQRFGNPLEVTGQLQESVPSIDAIWRFFEGHPEESMLCSAWRFVWVETLVCLVALGLCLFLAGWKTPWSLKELITVFSAFPLIPLWLIQIPLALSAIALLMCWIENSLRGTQLLPASNLNGLFKSFASAWAVPAVRRAMIGGGVGLLMMFMVSFVIAQWPTHPWGREHWIAIFSMMPMMSGVAVFSVFFAWLLVRPVSDRRRHHAEWSSLPIEKASW